VELALAGVSGGREDCIAETADLIYHITVLMEARGFAWGDVADKLRERHA
jgi:phosphoribosyl-ATP pyrophosphohydrolase